MTTIPAALAPTDRAEMMATGEGVGSREEGE
jgi:hypothetical protein